MMVKSPPEKELEEEGSMGTVFNLPKGEGADGPERIRMSWLGCSNKGTLPVVLCEKQLGSVGTCQKGG